MSYLRGPDRSEVQLLPACLDDFISPNASARFIDAYVENLDFKALGFARAQPADTGRPGYHPADLVKLYLYGYLHRVRSSRRLEAEAARNLELIWLLRGLRPDFKTIADFRKDNREAFPPLFRQFNLLCRRLHLFGAELVAIDGSKFKALNNVNRHYTEKQLNEVMGKVEARIQDYLTALDQHDAGAEGAPNRQVLREKIALLQERKGRYDELVQEMKTAGQKEISLTDPESRGLKGAHGEHLIGYNVQVAVDDKHHLIAAQEVVSEANDLSQLAPMAQAAKTELQIQQLQVVADKGYHVAGQLEKCEKAGIETFVPAPADKSSGKGGRVIFSREQFRYDPSADTYHCPGRQTLPRGGREQKRGQEHHLYFNPAACGVCALRSQCTTAAHRVITRRINQAVLERAAARLAAHPEKIAVRRETVEHVFGTIRLWEHDAFLMRGLAKVRAEFSLSALTHNLRRVLNLMKMNDLLQAVAVGG